METKHWIARDIIRNTEDKGVYWALMSTHLLLVLKHKEVQKENLNNGEIKCHSVFLESECLTMATCGQNLLVYLVFFLHIDLSQSVFSWCPSALVQPKYHTIYYCIYTQMLSI